MRITVGGILFVAGVGALVALGPWHMVDSTFIEQQTESVKKNAVWLLSLIKNKEADVVAAVPAVSEPEPVPVAETKPPPPTPELATTALPAEPVVAPPAQKIASKKKSRRRRTRAPKAANKPVSTVAPVKSAAKVQPKSTVGSSDPLIGTYVSMKLKTGNEVKGVLRAKSGTEYTLELPGMGPFRYPVENVISVSPAE